MSKKRPFEWGSKYWYYCASETGYFYQFDLYLGNKEIAKKNLGQGVVLKMTESLQSSHCMFFYNFFNSPSLKVKPY